MVAPAFSVPAFGSGAGCAGSFTNSRITNDTTATTARICTPWTTFSSVPLSTTTPPQKLGNPTFVKNQSELVSQIPTRQAKSSPPTSGSAQPGILVDRTHSTFVVNAP